MAVDTRHRQRFSIFRCKLPSARVFTGKAPLREITEMLAHDRFTRIADRLVTFSGLHDMPRFLHQPGATPESLKQVFTFLLTARGIPMIYYGDEIGMTGGDDPDNRRDFPGGWKEDPSNAFDSIRAQQVQEDLFEFRPASWPIYSKHAATPPGRPGRLAGGGQCLRLRRVTAESRLIVVFILQRRLRQETGCSARRSRSSERHAPGGSAGAGTPAVEARQGVLGGRVDHPDVQSFTEATPGNNRKKNLSMVHTRTQMVVEWDPAKAKRNVVKCRHPFGRGSRPWGTTAR